MKVSWLKNAGLFGLAVMSASKPSEVLSFAHSTSDMLLNGESLENKAEPFLACQPDTLVYDAAKNGDVDTMRYLVNTCQIDVKRMVEKENLTVYPLLDTILGQAVYSSHLALVRYLFEELEVIPSTQALKHLRSHAYFCSLELQAFLESFLIESPTLKSILLRLTEGLEQLDVPEALALYHARLPKEGARYELARYIHKKIATIGIQSLISEYDDSLKVSLLFCLAQNIINSRFRDDRDAFTAMSAIFDAGISVNVLNDAGNNLLYEAVTHLDGNAKMIGWLLKKGVNPDQPNHGGMTAINALGGQHLCVDLSIVTQAIQCAPSLVNSLTYAGKNEGDRSLSLILYGLSDGSSHLNLRALLQNIIQTHNHYRLLTLRLRELLEHVSISTFFKLRKLLNDDRFMASYEPNKRKDIRDTLVAVEELRYRNDHEPSILSLAGYALSELTSQTNRFFSGTFFSKPVKFRLLSEKEEQLCELNERRRYS